MTSTKINKLKYGDKIVVLQLKINDTVLDITGMFGRYILDRQTKVFRAEVYVNETWIILDQDRIIEYENWQPK